MQVHDGEHDRHGAVGTADLLQDSAFDLGLSSDPPGGPAHAPSGFSPGRAMEGIGFDDTDFDRIGLKGSSSSSASSAGDAAARQEAAARPEAARG